MVCSAAAAAAEEADEAVFVGLKLEVAAAGDFEGIDIDRPADAAVDLPPTLCEGKTANGFVEANPETPLACGDDGVEKEELLAGDASDEPFLTAFNRPAPFPPTLVHTSSSGCSSDASKSSIVNAPFGVNGCEDDVAEGGAVTSAYAGDAPACPLR